MYIGGYALLTAGLLGLSAFTERTCLGWAFAVSAIAGLGLGAIPTLDALIVQYVLPKRLLGTATGGIFFFVMLGRSVAPAILGSILNTTYRAALMRLLPGPVVRSMDTAALSMVSDARVPLSAQALDGLCAAPTSPTQSIPAPGLPPLVATVRTALEGSLQRVFLVGALTMLL